MGECQHDWVKVWQDGKVIGRKCVKCGREEGD